MCGSPAVFDNTHHRFLNRQEGTLADRERAYYLWSKCVGRISIRWGDLLDNLRAV